MPALSMDLLTCECYKYLINVKFCSNCTGRLPHLFLPEKIVKLMYFRSIQDSLQRRSGHEPVKHMVPVERMLSLKILGDFMQELNLTKSAFTSAVYKLYQGRVTNNS